MKAFTILATSTWPVRIDWPDPGCSSLLAYPASMKAKLGSVPLARSV